MVNPIYDIPFTSLQLEEITGISNLSVLEKGESIPKYIGFINNQKVVLRYLASSKVVSDRFNREGQALLLLAENKTQIESNGFTIPKIIDEWPKYQLRALCYLEGIEEYVLTRSEMGCYVNAFEGLQFNPQFDFKEGIFSNINQTDGINRELVGPYKVYRDEVIDTHDWPSNNLNLIHGDFHAGNLIMTNNGLIGILDWEYASCGSIYFDLAYYKSMSEKKIILRNSIKELVKPWEIYAILVLTHWYLVYYPNDISQGRFWLDKLGNALK